MRDSRATQIASALRLSYITIALNGVTGAAALTLAVLSGSLALAGFALSALLDTSASVVLVWRFRREQNDPAAAEHLERRAQAFIAVAMLVVSIYIGFKAVRALMDTSHVDEPLIGVALAALALIVLPWLGRRKFEVAAALESRALRGDAVLTMAAAALAAVTLVALVLASVAGWWWADPLAALVIAIALAVEATRIAIHHQFG